MVAYMNNFMFFFAFTGTRVGRLQNSPINKTSLIAELQICHFQTKYTVYKARQGVHCYLILYLKINHTFLIKQ